MATPKQVTVNGKKFIIHPLSVWKANAANSNLLAIFGPLMGGIFTGGLKAQLDLQAVSTVLLDMGEEKQSKLVSNLLSSCVWLPDSGPDIAPKELSDPANLEAAFSGDLEAMYLLAIEVMEACNFPFFKRAKALFGAFGSGMKKTDGSESPTNESVKTPGN